MNKPDWQPFKETTCNIFISDPKIDKKAIAQTLNITQDRKDMSKAQLFNLDRVYSPFEFVSLKEYNIELITILITGLQDIANPKYDGDGISYYPITKDVKEDKKEQKYSVVLKDNSEPRAMNENFLYDNVCLQERYNVDILTIMEGK